MCKENICASASFHPLKSFLAFLAVLEKSSMCEKINAKKQCKQNLCNETLHFLYKCIAASSYYIHIISSTVKENDVALVKELD